eukprot:CAMPEP_0168482260 /NCGR_PEP_ID=MMETSP0228-20121227/64941_1 /TAXON_ID=133427 /ORGANISM="Protoceratium reticulatum, Strain CCCM 535 (=CCMP 1889)" /LENGTH=35 /DNA_ID= /DNA_START= /DNA_END= /DNA_ORIENTATION=
MKSAERTSSTDHSSGSSGACGILEAWLRATSPCDR